MEWLEDWKVPGVCLLARSKVNNRGFAGKLANRFMTPSGIWLFAHQDEAMVIDAPYTWEDADPIQDRLTEFLKQQRLQLKFVTASHLHLDHAAGLASLLERLDARFVCPLAWQRHWKTLSLERLKCGIQPALTRHFEKTDTKSYEQTWTSDLAGEPLHFIHAPYHSPTDQLLVFRGMAILPDWHLPTSLEEPLQMVHAAPMDIAKTLERIRDLEQSSGYTIRQSCAVHGDEPLRNDFQQRVAMARQRFAVDHLAR